MTKDKDYNRLIHTVRWLKLRKSKLSDHPLCERCEEEGRITAATEVHHHVPVEYAITYAEKARLMYDPNNLRALCHNCHVKTHTEMGRSGRDATKRRTAEQVKKIVKKFFT